MRGKFVDALIDISVSTTLTAEVDLGGIYETLLIVIPTITSSKVSVKVAEKSGGTFQDLYLTDPDDGQENQIILGANTTGAFTWIVPLGGFQYIKLLCSVAQTSTDKTFRVAGI